MLVLIMSYLSGPVIEANMVGNVILGLVFFLMFGWLLSLGDD